MYARRGRTGATTTRSREDDTAGSLPEAASRDGRGYVGVGIYNGKRTYNFGALVRTARVFGADFVFSVGHRNPGEASSVNAELTVPVFHFETLELFVASIPVNAQLVCVELAPGALDIRTYAHPPRAVYLLGPEDGALPASIMRQHDTVVLPGAYPLNVAMAATVVLYDRLLKVRG
jgi:tRNA G18 (ribose-2'-O)-methylase SpoU